MKTIIQSVVFRNRTNGAILPLISLSSDIMNHSRKIFLVFFFFAISVTLLAQQVSDNAIKKNVKEISTPLQKVLQLEPKVFEYNTERYSHLQLPSGRKFGFMAENMQRLFPELVTTSNKSYMFGKNVYKNAAIKTIDESGLIPVLVASIKEQQAEIEKLKRDIADLQSGKITASP